MKDLIPLLEKVQEGEGEKSLVMAPYDMTYYLGNYQWLMDRLLVLDKADPGAGVQNIYQMPFFKEYYESRAWFAQAEKGVYFLSQDDSGIQLVKYYDYQTEQLIPLCNKPNCTHEDESCDAYFVQNIGGDEYQANNLVATKEQLYLFYTGKNQGIIEQADLDGSNREVIKQFDGDMIIDAVAMGDKIIFQYMFSKQREGSLAYDFGNSIGIYDLNDHTYRIVGNSEGTANVFAQLLNLEEGRLYFWVTTESRDSQGNVQGWKDKAYCYDLEKG